MEYKLMRTLFKIEIIRENVTPAQFIAYLRMMKRRHPVMANDFDLDYFRAGNDLNFDCEHDGIREKSVSRPYEFQTFTRGEDGSEYHEVCEFRFTDDKTGCGYYYTIQTEAEEVEGIA